MRYLTKEWCQLSHSTHLHFGLQAYEDAVMLNDSVYEQLKKVTTDAFLKQEKDFYDFDPRELFSNEGAVFIQSDSFISGSEISEKDTINYEMPEDVKEDIRQSINAFDSRGPFDVQKNILKFEEILEIRIKENEIKISKEIYSQIADPRVFALGYSTKSIIDQLEKMSTENKQKVQSVLKDFSLAMEKENIPTDLKQRFGFHDCVVKRIEKKKDITVEKS